MFAIAASCQTTNIVLMKMQDSHLSGVSTSKKPMNVFELRSYSRKELAMLYSPNISPDSACQNLRRWLSEHAEQKAFLDSIRNKRILKRREVEQIIALLGEP